MVLSLNTDTIDTKELVRHNSWMSMSLGCCKCCNCCLGCCRGPNIRGSFHINCFINMLIHFSDCIEELRLQNLLQCCKLSSWNLPAVFTFLQFLEKLTSAADIPRQG